MQNAHIYQPATDTSSVFGLQVADGDHFLIFLLTGRASLWPCARALMALLVMSDSIILLDEAIERVTKVLRVHSAASAHSLPCTVPVDEEKLPQVAVFAKMCCSGHIATIEKTLPQCDTS